LAGAVAKGAFEAGVLDVLSRHLEHIPIVRIVAASSGALNGAIYATGIRYGSEHLVAGRLVEMWLHDAKWHNVLKVSPLDILQGVGVGTGERLLPLMHAAVAELPVVHRRPIELELVLTALQGVPGNIDGQPATSFEHVASFRDEHFDSEQSRAQVFHTALGSGAFPLLFAPVDVPGVGLCSDGGVVNNTPIKRAIEGSAVERIIVVTPEPQQLPAPQPLRGAKLVTQLAEILINERLYRDLRDAEAINDYLSKLDELAHQRVPLDVIEKVKAVFGWVPLEIVQIRPPRPLDGSAFSAFSNTDQLRGYVAAGREAAMAALNTLLVP
jgi:predicted acylesterase/phospholipase RssA